MGERVRVREISNDEGNRLLRIVRRSSGSVVTWRRAQMVLLSAQGMDVPQIAQVAFTSEDRVRAVIHNFKDAGFDSLYPRYRGGRRARLECQTRCVDSPNSVRTYHSPPGAISSAHPRSGTGILRESSVIWKADRSAGQPGRGSACT